MDLSFTPLQEELREQARRFLADAAEPTWAQLAELGWTAASVAEEHGGAGLAFLEEAVLHEAAGAALLHASLWSTSTLVPFLPAEDQAAVASGEASWTLALAPLVPDLDTATHVAVVGGDTIWELEGAEREVLATSDESRPLGVVSGGEAGRELCASDVLPALRARSLTILALEAVGVAARALELAVAYASEREQFGRRIGTYQAVSHPLASSLADLKRRGMFEDTLVIATAEFGRTPKINKSAGRDHWPWVYSIALAGAGLKRGLVHGASDEIAAYPASHPVSPADFAATVYHLLGVPADTTIHDQLQRPHRLVIGKRIDAILT